MPPIPPFEQVVTEHGSIVLGVCRALLTPSDAEDAWSETFLAALQAYPRLRSGSNVRGWLVTIAHRKAIDRLRVGARAAVPVPTSELSELPGARRTPGSQPAAEPEVPGDRDPQLWAALQALPFKQRAAVTYHYLAGLPYAEIGALLDSNEAAARRNAADGLATLRTQYPPEKKDRKGSAPCPPPTT